MGESDGERPFRVLPKHILQNKRILLYLNTLLDNHVYITIQTCTRKQTQIQENTTIKPNESDPLLSYYAWATINEIRLGPRSHR